MGAVGSALPAVAPIPAPSARISMHSGTSICIQVPHLGHSSIIFLNHQSLIQYQPWLEIPSFILPGFSALSCMQLLNEQSFTTLFKHNVSLFSSCPCITAFCSGPRRCFSLLVHTALLSRVLQQRRQLRLWSRVLWW